MYHITKPCLALPAAQEYQLRPKITKSLYLPLPTLTGIRKTLNYSYTIRIIKVHLKDKENAEQCAISNTPQYHHYKYLQEDAFEELLPQL